MKLHKTGVREVNIVVSLVLRWVSRGAGNCRALQMLSGESFVQNSRADLIKKKD